MYYISLRRQKTADMLPGLPKPCAIWISSPENLSENNWRCSVVFFKAQKKLRNDGSVKQEKIMKDGQ